MNIAKACIMTDFTNILDKHDEQGTTKLVIEQIKSVNQEISKPENIYNIHGEFTFYTIDKDEEDHFILIFWDYLDSKPRKRTIDSFKKCVHKFIMDTNYIEDDGPVTELPIPYRIVNNRQSLSDDEIKTVINNLIVN